MQINRPDKIICVGRNYLKHALELGSPVPTEALYFIKPASTLIYVESEQDQVLIPTHRGEVHHELELVLRVEQDRNGRFDFSHFTYGLDLTLRDLQNQLKKAGQPWEKAKVFKNSSIIGPWLPFTTLDAVMNRPFELHVNGEVRQKGMGRDMKWGPDFLIEDLPNWFPMLNGDLIYTGTPEGVAALKPGDHVQVKSLDYGYSFNCV